MGIFLSGIADEAGHDIRTQFRAIREIGWEHIEMRMAQVPGFNSANLHDIPDEAFEVFAREVEEAGLHVSCFGSTIMNWGKQVTDPLDITLAEVRRAIPRMKRVRCPFIRIMSFAVLKDRPPEAQMKEERFRIMREVVKMFHDEGLTPVHENCMNYGGMGWTFTLELLEAVPGLKLVFDTGNPVFTDDRSKPPPHPKQSAWEFYQHVREHIAYVHIKDGKWIASENRTEFCWPGDGDGDVRRILIDLLRTGYEGGISIEPHMAAVFHDDSIKSTEEAKFQTFVEYGRRMTKLLHACQDEVRSTPARST